MWDLSEHSSVLFSTSTIKFFLISLIKSHRPKLVVTIISVSLTIYKWSKSHKNEQDMSSLETRMFCLSLFNASLSWQNPDLRCIFTYKRFLLLRLLTFLFSYSMLLQMSNCLMSLTWKRRFQGQLTIYSIALTELNIMYWLFTCKWLENIPIFS